MTSASLDPGASLTVLSHNKYYFVFYNATVYMRLENSLMKNI